MIYASTKLENALRGNGQMLVCGIDEVGRGSLAGPLVAGSVILPAGWRQPLRDSKLLNSTSRQVLSEFIIKKALASGLGWVSNAEIDNLGLTESVRLAYLRALEAMNAEFSLLIIDGNYDYLSEYGVAQAIVKADQQVSCVAAASIIAKVARDNYMIKQARQYPDYSFDTNVGYGTQTHLSSIRQNGLTNLHRQSFCGNYL